MPPCRHIAAVRLRVSNRHEAEYSVHVDEHNGMAMTGQHSIAEARRNLPTLVRDAENGKAVELTRRGELVAVLIGRREFERLTSGRRGFADAYRGFAQSVELAKLALDPDELFGVAREEGGGRDVWL